MDLILPRGKPFPVDASDAPTIIIPKDGIIGALPMAYPLPFGHSIKEGSIWDDDIHTSLLAGGPMTVLYADCLHKEFPQVRGPAHTMKVEYFMQEDAMSHE